VVSVAKGINISGKQHVMFNAQGVHLKLEGGNIELYGRARSTWRPA